MLLETDKETPQESANKIMSWLEAHDYVPAIVEDNDQVYSSEEAEAVKQRLKALGYVE